MYHNFMGKNNGEKHKESSSSFKSSQKSEENNDTPSPKKRPSLFKLQHEEKMAKQKKQRK